MTDTSIQPDLVLLLTAEEAAKASSTFGQGLPIVTRRYLPCMCPYAAGQVVLLLCDGVHIRNGWLKRVDRVSLGALPGEHHIYLKPIQANSPGQPKPFRR